jgi:hypothetical protein
MKPTITILPKLPAQQALYLGEVMKGTAFETFCFDAEIDVTDVLENLPRVNEFLAITHEDRFEIRYVVDYVEHFVSGDGVEIGIGVSIIDIWISEMKFYHVGDEDTYIRPN